MLPNLLAKLLKEKGSFIMANVSGSRIIETKIPLTWLVTSVLSVVLAFGGLFVKVDNATSAVSELKAKIESRDDRMTMLIQGLTEVKGVNSMQQSQIDRVQTDLIDVRRDLIDVRQSAIKGR
jgi:hypothetical protein